MMRPTGQGMGETMPAQNIARITSTMTDVNKASFNSLVICVPSFVRLASGCRLTPTLLLPPTEQNRIPQMGYLSLAHIG